MLTGQDIDKNFDWKIDKSFSAYISNAEKNRLFRNTLFNLADKKWFGLSDQKAYDELSSMVSTEASFTMNGNLLPTAPILLNSISVTSGVYTVLTYFPHQLIVGDTVRFERLTGNYSNLNGNTFTVTVIPGSNQLQFTQGNSTFAAITRVGILYSNKMCSDYLHHFASRAQFADRVANAAPQSNSDTSPIRITTRSITSIRNGERLQLSGFANAALNGTFYAKAVNSKNFDLFLDQDLTLPTPQTTAEEGITGMIYRIVDQYTVPVFSDRKIDPFYSFDIHNPGVEFSKKLIKVYPLNKPCLLLTMDYMQIPDPFIDVDDGLTDLELIYPGKFLYRLIAEAAMLYSSPSRDQMLQRDMQLEIVQNP